MTEIKIARRESLLTPKMPDMTREADYSGKLVQRAIETQTHLYESIARQAYESSVIADAELHSSEATLELAEAFKKRASERYDKDGNPNYGSLVGDMKETAGKIKNEAHRSLETKDAKRQFDRSFERDMLRTLLSAGDEQRRQKVEYLQAESVQVIENYVKAGLAGGLDDYQVARDKIKSFINTQVLGGVLSTKEGYELGKKTLKFLGTAYLVDLADASPVEALQFMERHKPEEFDLDNEAYRKVKDAVLSAIQRAEEQQRKEDNKEAKEAYQKQMAADINNGNKSPKYTDREKNELLQSQVDKATEGVPQKDYARIAGGVLLRNVKDHTGSLPVLNRYADGAMVFSEDPEYIQLAYKILNDLSLRPNGVTTYNGLNAETRQIFEHSQVSIKSYGIPVVQAVNDARMMHSGQTEAQIKTNASKYERAKDVYDKGVRQLSPASVDLRLSLTYGQHTALKLLKELNIPYSSAIVSDASKIFKRYYIIFGHETSAKETTKAYLARTVTKSGLNEGNGHTQHSPEQRANVSKPTVKYLSDMLFAEMLGDLKLPTEDSVGKKYTKADFDFVFVPSEDAGILRYRVELRAGGNDVPQGRANTLITDKSGSPLYMEFPIELLQAIDTDFYNFERSALVPLKESNLGKNPTSLLYHVKNIVNKNDTKTNYDGKTYPPSIPRNRWTTPHPDDYLKVNKGRVMYNKEAIREKVKQAKLEDFSYAWASLEKNIQREVIDSPYIYEIISQRGINPDDYWKNEEEMKKYLRQKQNREEAK